MKYAPHAVAIADYLGPDSAYFLGLHFRDAGDGKTAAALFDHGIKTADPSIAKLCRMALTETGSAASRQKNAEELFKLYPDDDGALVRYAEVLLENGKFREALDLASREPHDEEAANALSRLRILARLQIEDAGFMNDFQTWFSQNQMTDHHQQFLEDVKDIVLSSVSGLAEGQMPTDVQVREAASRSPALRTIYGSLDNNPETASYMLNTARMRANVFAKNYGSAAETAKALLPQATDLTSFEVSDMGKALLYSGAQYTENAYLLDTVSEVAAEPESKFMAVFYAGRLYDRAEEFASAAERYRRAIDTTKQPERRDTALWYYLITLLKTSPEKAVEALAEYGPTWHDSDYFSDFLERLSSALFGAKKWDMYYQVYKLIQPFASPVSIAQYAYVSGRLIEEKLISKSILTHSAEKESKDAFETAFSQDHSGLYYHFLAAGKLDKPIEDAVFRRRKNTDFRQNRELEILLNGYAQYGFPEKVYPAAMKDIGNVSLDIATELARKVAEMGPLNPKLYADSLRLITSALSKTNGPVTLDNLMLLYPRPYHDLVEQASQEFYLEEYLIYGLMRSESFFDKDIVSHAGAIGLTQLMKPTAGDVAKKLRVSDYDLLDPATNIRFGSYYLSELLGRLNEIPILALFSYNAGITRVRNWLRTSGDLPLDLFLESVPITETREYGRKVLTAGSMYGYLYYAKSPKEVVGELFPDPFVMPRLP